MNLDITVWNLGKDILDGDLNLWVSMEMIFKAITLDAITKGVSVDSEKYR